MTARIDAVLRAAVDNGVMPNVVGVAADDTDVIYEGAAGPRAVGGSEPVGADSIFRIASMTKIVCTVAALQQRDCGNLDFDAPVDGHKITGLQGGDSQAPDAKRLPQKPSPELPRQRGAGGEAPDHATKSRIRNEAAPVHALRGQRPPPN